MKTAQNELNTFNGGKKRLAILVAVVLPGVFAVAGLVIAADIASRSVPEPQHRLPTPGTERFTKVDE